MRTDGAAMPARPDPLSVGETTQPGQRFSLSRRWLARATGVLYSIGAITAFVWVSMATPGERGIATIIAMASIALVLGLALALGAADQEPWTFFHAVIMVIQLVITVGYSATGNPLSSTGLFFIWTTTYAWLLFDRRAALVQSGWMGICLGLALWGMSAEVNIGARVWLMIMSTSLSLGVLISVVAERMRCAQEQLSHEVSHDPLTGLPNRAYFANAVRTAATRCVPAGELVYLLLIGLDHFKLVNDSYGHRTGDEVLCVLAERLAEAVGPGHTLARTGGDEFAVVCCMHPNQGDALSRLRARLSSVWSEPVPVTGGSLAVSATVGVAEAVEEAAEEELMRRADVALAHAKRTDRGSIAFFDDDLLVQVNRRNALGQALSHALARDELTVYYQPIVCLRDRRILGAEALLRWKSASLGDVSPAEFIPVAEETGLIVPIGEWVLGAATAQLAQWRRDGVVNDEFRLSLNVSVRQLTTGFAGTVLRRLAECALPRRVVALEITESVLLDDTHRFAQVRVELQQSGLQLTLDDFGTGYSSITYLQQLPLQAMKVDRSFVTDLPASPTDRSLVAAMTAMGRSLGMIVVAEGVETEEQATMVEDFGAQRAQGYLFGRPMPAADFARHVQAPRVANSPA